MYKILYHFRRHKKYCVTLDMYLTLPYSQTYTK